MVLVRTALLLCLLGSRVAFAWGDDGHRITGYIADSLLTSQTKQHIRSLLGTDDLSAVATWMDDEREALHERWPASPRWHYENRSVCGNTRRKACPYGDCITHALKRDLATLRDNASTREDRADALRMVVHLVGDLHQPLHLTDNRDRGGNDYWASMPHDPEPHRLHEVWDTLLVRMNRGARSDAAYAHDLEDGFASQAKTWQRGSIEDWAKETHDIGVRAAYRALPQFRCNVVNTPATHAAELPDSYLQRSRGLVDAQLAKAGIRLAWLLNRVFAQ